MNKIKFRIIITSIVAFISIVVIIIVGNICLVKPTIVEQNKYITLSPEKDYKTSGFFGYTASLPWKSGEMDFKINSCNVYTELSDVDDMLQEDKDYVEKIHSFTKEDEIKYGDILFLVVDITIKNNSAVLDENGYMFINFFRPIPVSAFLENESALDYYVTDCVYFDKHKPFNELVNNSYKDYFAIKSDDLLNSNEYNFKLGYFLDKSTVLNNELVISIGTSSSNKYGIKCDALVVKDD